MEFFRLLFALLPAGAHFNLQVKEKNGKYTVGFVPAADNPSAIKPVFITGTPEELDAGFMEKLAPTMATSTMTIVGLAEHEKSVADLKDSKGKADKAKPPKGVANDPKEPAATTNTPEPPPGISNDPKPKKPAKKQPPAKTPPPAVENPEQSLFDQ